MTDREKVIKALEICFTPKENCKECPYDELGLVPNCTKALGEDAIALLNEQEKKIRQLRLALQIMNGKGIKVDTKGRD